MIAYQRIWYVAVAGRMVQCLLSGNVSVPNTHKHIHIHTEQIIDLSTSVCTTNACNQWMCAVSTGIDHETLLMTAYVRVLVCSLCLRLAICWYTAAVGADPLHSSRCEQEDLVIDRRLTDWLFIRAGINCVVAAGKRPPRHLRPLSWLSLSNNAAAVCWATAAAVIDWWLVAIGNEECVCGCLNYLRRCCCSRKKDAFLS